MWDKEGDFARPDPRRTIRNVGLRLKGIEKIVGARQEARGQ